MKDLSDWKTNSMQKHIPNMSRDGSQTKRKRDATTGSTVKAHLDWRDRYLDKFHTTPHKGIEEFINNLLSTQRQEVVEEIMKLEIGEFEGWDLAKKFNCCPGDDMADAYNQALKDVIKSLNMAKTPQLDWEGLLKEIIEHNKDDMTGLYDFDGIALEVISLVKK